MAEKIISARQEHACISMPIMGFPPRPAVLTLMPLTTQPAMLAKVG